jgi:dihydrofolate reductase
VPAVEPAVVPPPAFTCVLAADDDRGIGIGSGLPWPKLAGDVAHFKAITTQTREPGRRNAIVMGRRTWDTLPARCQPLPGRLNIVVSRQALVVPDGVLLAAGLDAAMAAATSSGVETIHMVGGGSLYAEALRHPGCQVVYYTRIAGRFQADTFVPAFEDDFVLEASEPRSDAGVAYVIERWRRR